MTIHQRREHQPGYGRRLAGQLPDHHFSERAVVLALPSGRPARASGVLVMVMDPGLERVALADRAYLHGTASRMCRGERPTRMSVARAAMDS
jgi:hypothetical protein